METLDIQNLPPADEIITPLRKSLEEPYSRPDRAPTKFDEKLKSTCLSNDRNILLDTGFQAWFAYIQADPRAQAAFDQLPYKAAIVVARQLCSIKPHPSVEALFHHIFHGSFRGGERRSCLQSSRYTYPPFQLPTAPDSSSPGSAASAQLQNHGEPQPTHNHAQQSNSEQQGGASPGSPASAQLHSPGDPRPVNNHIQWNRAEQPIPLNSNAQPNNAALQPQADNANTGMRLPPLMDSMNQGRGGLQPLAGHPQDRTGMPSARRGTETHADNPLWTSPFARNIPSLLPHRISSSVVRTYKLAAMRLVPGRTPSQWCLEVDICASRVPYIAWELFGANLDIEEQRLWIRLTSGSSMSFESTTLSGADRKGAENLLGTLSELVKADTLYAEEFEEGRSRTSLISLDIKGNAEDPSCLKIRSTAHTASIIAGHLWPGISFPQG